MTEIEISNVVWAHSSPALFYSLHSTLTSTISVLAVYTSQSLQSSLQPNPFTMPFDASHVDLLSAAPKSDTPKADPEVDNSKANPKSDTPKADPGEEPTEVCVGTISCRVEIISDDDDDDDDNKRSYSSLSTIGSPPPLEDSQTSVVVESDDDEPERPHTPPPLPTKRRRVDNVLWSPDEVHGGMSQDLFDNDDNDKEAQKREDDERHNRFLDAQQRYNDLEKQRYNEKYNKKQ